MCTRSRLDVLGKGPWKEVFQEAVAKTWKSSFSWGSWWCLHLFAWRITCERGSILHSVAWQGAGGGDRRAMNSGHAPQQRYWQPRNLICFLRTSKASERLSLLVSFYGMKTNFIKMLNFDDVVKCNILFFQGYISLKTKISFDEINFKTNKNVLLCFNKV